MQLIIRPFIFILFLPILFQSCDLKSKKETATLSPMAHKVKVLEVIQTSGYTYVRVSADGTEYWLAIDRADIEKDKTYYWTAGTLMKDFTSRELKRTFRTIVFVQDFTSKPILLDPTPDMESKMQAASAIGRQTPRAKTGISVERAPGGITIAELYAKKAAYSGKEVSIRGEVVRFSKEIMGKNWVHLQDGTKDSSGFDLTITTLDSLKVGDVVIFKGKISLKKDFGSGYFYEVLMEDGTIRK
jgi:hypothetical protein